MNQKRKSSAEPVYEKTIAEGRVVRKHFLAN